MLPQQLNFVGGRSLHETLWQFQQSCQFTDLTLSCSDGTIPAHRAMLTCVFKLLGIPIEGQDGEMECLVIPDAVVSEVEQALEELYLKSDSVKLLNHLCYTKVKSEKVDVLSIVEVKPEVSSDEEWLPADQVMEYEDDDEIKQDLFQFKDTLEVTKVLRKYPNLVLDPPSPFNAKNLHIPKPIEQDSIEFKGKKKYKLRKKKEKKSLKVEHICTECGKIFKTKKQFKRHQRSHDIASVQCEICAKTFSERSHLVIHQKSIHEGLTYKCNSCDQTFTQKQNLTRHVASIHVGIKVQCQECKKMFADLGGLTKHKREVHEGRRIKCKDCDKTFSQSSSLNKHHKSEHQGIKYKCDICEKLFNQKLNLLRHTKLHEGVKYDCDECNYQGNSTQAVKMHKVTKHEGVRYFCDQCEYQATTQYSLRRHADSVQ